MTDYPPRPPHETYIAERPGNGMAIAALVLGIMSLVFFCIVYVAMPSAILGIVFGFIGRGKARTGASGGGMATAGLVCAFISIGLWLLMFILFLAGIAAVPGFLQAIQQAAEQAAEQGASSAPAP
ncbi:MAG: DUF4190 domain-containing protein [Planctomycetota bacterium]